MTKGNFANWLESRKAWTNRIYTICPDTRRSNNYLGQRHVTRVAWWIGGIKCNLIKSAYTDRGFLFQANCVRQERDSGQGGFVWQVVSTGGAESLLHISDFLVDPVVYRTLYVLFVCHHRHVVVRYHSHCCADSRGMNGDLTVTLFYRHPFCTYL